MLFEFRNVNIYCNLCGFKDLNVELLSVVDDTLLKIAPLTSGRMRAAISECKQFRLSGRKKPRQKRLTEDEK